MIGEILVTIGLIGLIVLGLLILLSNILFYFFSDKMVNIGDIYINMNDKKNPFIEHVRYAEIVEKEFDENGDLWIRFDYFVKPGDTKIYDEHKYYFKYKNFLETHRLEEFNKE
jgi:hypothetical protein